MPCSTDRISDRSQTLINRLRMIVFECGFTDEDVKQFGNLNKIATWESLLKFYLVKAKPLDTMLDKPLDNSGLDTELDTHI